MDLVVSTPNGTILSQCDKRDDFDHDVVSFHFLDGDILGIFTYVYVVFSIFVLQEYVLTLINLIIGMKSCLQNILSWLLVSQIS